MHDKNTSNNSDSGRAVEVEEYQGQVFAQVFDELRREKLEGSQ